MQIQDAELCCRLGHRVRGHRGLGVLRLQLRGWWGEVGVKSGDLTSQGWKFASFLGEEGKKGIPSLRNGSS